jgi:hypothetical protein
VSRKGLATGLFIGVLGLVLSGCTNSSGANHPTVGGPPPGHYLCRAGGFKGLYSGEFDIRPGWRYVGIQNRGGVFRYDEPKKMVVFTTGDFEYWDFIAQYQSAAESSDGRERLVLKDESAPEAIGQEKPGEFQYCYMSTSTNGVAVSRDSDAPESVGKTAYRGTGE